MSKKKYNDADLFYMREMYKKIKKCVLKQDVARAVFCNRYKISEEYFDACIELFDNNGDVSVKLAENEEKFLYMKELCYDVPRYLENGIEVDGKIISFSGLDYYSLTNESMRKFKTIFLIAYDDKDFKKHNVLVSTFVDKASFAGSLLKKEDFLKLNIRYFNGEETFVVNEEVVDYVYNLFDENDIPRRRNLVEKAIERYFNNLPILPYRDARNNEKDNILIKK